MNTKTPLIWTVQFQDKQIAESAEKTVTEMLSAAQRETDALFEAQDGIAEAADVAEIYARYGFRNDCGWQQTVPLKSDGEMLQWVLPEGMDLQEVEQLLTALGALNIERETVFEDDLMRDVPHPAALFLSEIDEISEFEDDDPQWGDGMEKKILH